MVRLAFILVFSSIGGTLIIHYLKNFLLKEKKKFYFDWDGLIERLCITYIIVSASHLLIFIPLIIIVKVIFRLSLLGFFPGITRSREAGSASQKVLLKSELAFDLFLSPAFAILVGVIFK